MNLGGFLALAWGRLRSKLGLTWAICSSTLMIIALTVGIPQFANAVGKLTVQDELARSAQISASPPFAVRSYSSMGTGRTLGSIPSRWAMIFSTSMMRVMSIPCGQRVEQVSQAAQSQIVLELRISSFWPNWAARRIWFGIKSKCSATGQPAVHFWH